MSLLLIDAQAGCAGDMFVAAAAQLAACEDEVRALPARLGLSEVSCDFRDVLRAGMQARKFDVLENGRPAESVTAVPYRHTHGHQHHHAHGHDHSHHDHTHGHDRHRDHHAAHADHPHHPHDPHEHRSLSHIEHLLQHAELEAAVRERAIRMFRRLGAVEAAAHGVDIEAVHFHEVGAIDAIIDITAAALCIERLQMTSCVCTPICVGHGTVHTAHGLLPVPAPATERLLRGMPQCSGEIAGEWCTPTGALIIAELQPAFQQPEALSVQAAAWGAGGKDLPQRPNALRLRLASAAAGGLQQDSIGVLTTNLDDMPGELLGQDFQEALFATGAVDVCLTPVLMKKGRPGQRLEVLCPPEHLQSLASLLLTHTSAIGLRHQILPRYVLPRQAVTVQTAFGAIACKSVTLPDGSQRFSPEYESCRQAAAAHGVPIAQVQEAVVRAWQTAPAV
ncbi:MAG: nickel pincer cofactor biosynthesis protein LarC [Planctomycetota bacterium]